MAPRLTFVLLCLAAAPAMAATEGALVGGTSWIAWAMGLVCGIALMALTTLDWRRIPDMTLFWLRRQRKNAWWAALGVASLAVITFY